MLYLVIVLLIIFLLICWEKYNDSAFTKEIRKNNYIVIEKYYYWSAYSKNRDYYIKTRHIYTLKTKTISVSEYEWSQNTIGHTLKLGICK